MTFSIQTTVNLLLLHICINKFIPGILQLNAKVQKQKDLKAIRERERQMIAQF